MRSGSYKVSQSSAAGRRGHSQRSFAASHRSSPSPTLPWNATTQLVHELHEGKPVALIKTDEETAAHQSDASVADEYHQSRGMVLVKLNLFRCVSAEYASSCPRIDRVCGCPVGRSVQLLYPKCHI